MRSEDTLSTIKTESIRAVYHTLLTGGELSRAETAEKTGLSLMTTCKICDALIDCGFFRQEKDTRQKSGRKASLIAVNPQRYSLLLTLSADSLIADLIDMTMQHTDRITQPAGPLESVLPFFLLTLFTQWADRLENLDGIAYFIDQFPPETEETIAQIFPNIAIYPLTPAEAVHSALKHAPNTLFFTPQTAGLFYISRSSALLLHPEAFITADSSPSRTASALGKLIGLFGAAGLILEHPSAALAAHLPQARVITEKLPVLARGTAEIIRRRRLDDLLERVKPI